MRGPAPPDAQEQDDEQREDDDGDRLCGEHSLSGDGLDNPGNDQDHEKQKRHPEEARPAQPPQTRRLRGAQEARACRREPQRDSRQHEGEREHSQAIGAVAWHESYERDHQQKDD